LSFVSTFSVILIHYKTKIFGSLKQKSMKKTLLSFIAICGLGFGSSAQVQNYTVGATVADFTVTDVHGQTHTLSSITAQGKYVFLDFFFTTCPPCQATVPMFSELHQKYGCNAGNVYCLSIDLGDTDAEVLAFEATYSASGGHVPAPAASGTEGGGDAVVAAFGVGAYPTYCIIGPDMKMKNTDVWPISNLATFETALTTAGATLTPMNCVLTLDENVLSNSIEVYPNPAVNNATISFNMNEASGVNITVYNMVGSLVSNESIAAVSGSNNYNLNVSNLENGQYIVKINLENGLTARKSMNILR
jgi:thiol-disulfide isomerase/thioredoxin